MEMALTGDVVDAATAAEWGLINKAVPDDELDSAVEDLLARANPGQPGEQGNRQADPLRRVGTGRRRTPTPSRWR